MFDRYIPITKTENNGTLYIIMRNDLPSMNHGKALAQASHASSMLVNMLTINDTDKETREAIERWIDEGKGFGTTIVMESCHLRNIRHCIDVLDRQGFSFIHGFVKDETYPFLLQKELGRLLHPNIQTELQIHIDEDAKMDSYGMIKATRPETTCGWIFIKNGNEEEVKQIFEEHGIKLAR